MQDYSFTMNVKLSKFIKTNVQLYKYANQMHQQDQAQKKKAKGTDKWCVLLYLTTTSIHCIENRTILYIFQIFS